MGTLENSGVVFEAIITVSAAQSFKLQEDDSYFVNSSLIGTRVAVS